MGFREHFSSEVRRLRDKHGMTTRELAAEVGYSYDSLKSFLVGHRTPTSKLAANLDGFFGTDGMFAALREQAEADSTSFGELKENEQRAIAIRIWDWRIPGLLQTPRYASAMLSNSLDVDARLQRQGIFERENPPHVHVIIPESVLYIEIGGMGVLREQLEHLIREDAPWILQIIPDRYGAHTGLDGPLTLLEFEGDEPSIAYLDSRQGGTVADEPGQVSEYWQQWEALTSDALPASVSREMIRDMIRELPEE